MYLSYSCITVKVGRKFEYTSKYNITVTTNIELFAKYTIIQRRLNLMVRLLLSK